MRDFLCLILVKFGNHILLHSNIKLVLYYIYIGYTCMYSIFHSIAKYMCIYIHTYIYICILSLYIYIYYGQIPRNLTMAPLLQDFPWSLLMSRHPPAAPARMPGAVRWHRRRSEWLVDWWTSSRQTWGYEKAILIWNIKGINTYTGMTKVALVERNPQWTCLVSSSAHPFPVES